MKKHILCLELALERCQEVMESINSAYAVAVDHPALKEEMAASIDALMDELAACQAEAWRAFFYYHPLGSCPCGKH